MLPSDTVNTIRLTKVVLFYQCREEWANRAQESFPDGRTHLSDQSALGTMLNSVAVLGVVAPMTVTASPLCIAYEVGLPNIKPLSAQQRFVSLEIVSCLQEFDPVLLILFLR